MAKYLVETYYTCSFKVSHYLDNVNDSELSNLEKRDDGKFEILDIKFDKRNTKSLDKKPGQVEVNYNDSVKNISNKTQNQYTHN